MNIFCISSSSPDENPMQARLIRSAHEYFVWKLLENEHLEARAKFIVSVATQKEVDELQGIGVRIEELGS